MKSQICDIHRKGGPCWCAEPLKKKEKAEKGCVSVCVEGGGSLYWSTLCHGSQNSVKLTGRDPCWHSLTHTHTHTRIIISLPLPPLLAVEHAECGKQRQRHAPDKILLLWASMRMQTGPCWHAAAAAHKHILFDHRNPELPSTAMPQSACHLLPLLSLFMKSLTPQNAPFSHLCPL